MKSDIGHKCTYRTCCMPRTEGQILQAGSNKMRSGIEALLEWLEVHALGSPNITIAFKCAPFIFQSQQRLESAAAERMTYNTRRVTEDEQRIALHCHRDMAKLHPTLRSPAHEFHLHSGHVFGAHYGGCPVIF